jgi:hypothetical protein
MGKQTMRQAARLAASQVQAKRTDLVSAPRRASALVRILQTLWQSSSSPRSTRAWARSSEPWKCRTRATSPDPEMVWNNSISCCPGPARLRPHSARPERGRSGAECQRGFQTIAPRVGVSRRLSGGVTGLLERRVGSCKRALPSYETATAIAAASVASAVWAFTTPVGCGDGRPQRELIPNGLSIASSGDHVCCSGYTG